MNDHKKRLYGIGRSKAAASGASRVAGAVGGAAAAAKTVVKPAAGAAAAAPKGPGLFTRVMDAIVNKTPRAPANPADKLRTAMTQARLRNPDLDVDNMSFEDLMPHLDGISAQDFADLGPNAEQTLHGIKKQVGDDYGKTVSRFTAERDDAIGSAVSQREQELGQQFASEQDKYRTELHAETDPSRVRMMRNGLIGAAAMVPAVGAAGAFAGHKVTQEKARRDLGRQRLLAFGAGAAAGSVLPGTVGNIGRTLTQASQIPQQFQRDYARFGGTGPPMMGGQQYKMSNDKTAASDDDMMAQMSAALRACVQK